MLITTKFQIPQLRSRMLFRKDLIERLCAAKTYPLIVLSGSTGFGKTSLVCQWLSQERLPVAWYSLDDEDNEPDLFFRYLLTALSQTDELLDRTFAPLLANRRELSGKTVIPHLIESLFGMEREIRLVLDDFHHIQNREIHATLARLIQYMPSHLHLIILSRRRLPTPMGAVALKKERLEISISDLKFTEKETADLFKKIIPISFSADQIHKLNQHVEGWAAGLQLIGLSVRSKGRGTDLSYIMNQAHDRVAGYLINDILEMQPERIRRFVFITALLDRFNPELCAELTGHADAAGILSRLARMNLFLIPLDTDQKWYRYHHMFSEIARRQVALETPDLISETLCKAALWFAKNSYLEDALRSAFRSGDLEFAADLMEDYILQYIVQHDPTAGFRWILRLPRDILNQRGLLRLYQCGFLLILVEYAEIKKILSELEEKSSLAFERYSDNRRAFCEEYRIFYNCVIQILYTYETANAAQLQDLRHKFSPQLQRLSSGIEMLMVFLFILKGDLTLAERSLAKTFDQHVWHEYTWQKIYLLIAKALIARNRGRLCEAEAILNQALQSITSKGHDNTPMAFFFHRHLGHIFYLQNKLEKAREYAAIAAQHNEYAGLFDEVMTGYELRFQLHLAAGETELAAERIQQIKAFAVKLEKPAIAASAEANAAMLAIVQGNLTAAGLWSWQRKFRLDEPFSLLFAMECLTLARLAYALEQYTDAADMLETLRNRCRKRGLRELMFRIDILRAAVFYALDRRDAAKSLLRKALAFSETEGYVRPFVNDAGMIAPILRSIAEELPGDAFTSHYKTVWAACKIPLDQSAALSPRESDMYEELTQREIEILKWVAEGFQNKEIAQKAFISISTVKCHVSNILVKLGVKNRTQATLKAKKMDLFIEV